MLRGNRSIYISLFPKEIAPVIDPANDRKGRSEFLILKRNEFLISRYYYYAKLSGKKYEVCLALLEEETFLTQRTIVDILTRDRDLLKHFITSKADTKVFKSKYPHVVWN